MLKVGQNIKNERIKLGLSQADAAKLLRISTPALCKIETGQTDLNVSRLIQIAKVFNVSVLRLLGSNTDDNQLIEENLAIKLALAEKEEELNKLRKKIIELYDKLGM